MSGHVVVPADLWEAAISAMVGTRKYRRDFLLDQAVPVERQKWTPSAFRRWPDVWREVQP